MCIEWLHGMDGCVFWCIRIRVVALFTRSESIVMSSNFWADSIIDSDLNPQGTIVHAIKTKTKRDLRVDSFDTLDAASQLLGAVALLGLPQCDSLLHFAVVKRLWAPMRFVCRGLRVRLLAFGVHLAAVETGLLGAERHCLLRVVIREKVCHFFFLFAGKGDPS